MTRTEILENEINIGIDKINLLTENDKFEVQKIYSDIFNIFKKLSKEDFIHEIYYTDFLKGFEQTKNFIRNEIEDLITVKSDIYTKDNYFQIKTSLLLMRPHKVIK